MRCSSCSAEVKWVVAVDIDGTLAKYHRGYRDFVAKYDERDDLPLGWDGIGEFRDALGLTKREHHERKLAYRAGGFKRWMDAFPYVSTMMHELKRLNVEIWMTTTRPWMRMDNVDTDTVEWLRRNGVPHDHLLFDEDKYGKLLELVDPERIVAVLDDEEEQRDRCAQLRLPFVLRSMQWNTGIKNHSGPAIEDLFEFPNIVKERIGMRDALQH